MKIALVDARFDVGILAQLTQRIGVVEVQVRGGENPPRNSPVAKVRENACQDLHAACRNEGDGERETCAVGELRLESRQHVGASLVVVAEDARRIALVGFFPRTDEARLEAFRELHDAVFEFALHLRPPYKGRIRSTHYRRSAGGMGQQPRHRSASCSRLHGRLAGAGGRASAGAGRRASRMSGRGQKRAAARASHEDSVPAPLPRSCYTFERRSTDRYSARDSASVRSI